MGLLQRLLHTSLADLSVEGEQVAGAVGVGGVSTTTREYAACGRRLAVGLRAPASTDTFNVALTGASPEPMRNQFDACRGLRLGDSLRMSPRLAPVCSRPSAVGARARSACVLGARLADRATAVAGALLYPLHARGASRRRPGAAPYALVCSGLRARRARLHPRLGPAALLVAVGGRRRRARGQHLGLPLACSLAPLALVGFRRENLARVAGGVVVPIFAAVGVLRGSGRRPGRGAARPDRRRSRTKARRWLSTEIAGEQYFNGPEWWVVGGWLLAAAGLYRVAVAATPQRALLAAWILVPTPCCWPSTCRCRRCSTSRAT